MIPDGKKVVADYLRSHSSITALNARVVGKSPDGDNRTLPWIRVTQLDAQNSPGAIAEHLLSYLLQLDCFVAPGEGHPQARTLAHTVRAALTSAPATQSGGVLCTARFVGEAELTDTDSESEREYVALTAEVFIHG